MVDKELKKEYDKRRTNVLLTLNHKELTVLQKLMEKDGWCNRSGFIKEAIFGENINTKYKKVLRNGSDKDIVNAIHNLLQELVNDYGYINYRFNYELEKIEKDDPKISQKKLNVLKAWRDDVAYTTEDTINVLMNVLKAQKIKVEIERQEAIRYAPDSVLKEKLKDWNDISSPEIIELGRRIGLQREELAKKRKEKK